MAKGKDDDGDLGFDKPKSGKKSQAYTQGYDAARNGSDVTANPYQEDPDRAQWFAGFDDQKAEAGPEFSTEQT